MSFSYISFDRVNIENTVRRVHHRVVCVNYSRMDAIQCLPLASAPETRRTSSGSRRTSTAVRAALARARAEARRVKRGCMRVCLGMCVFEWNLFWSFKWGISESSFEREECDKGDVRSGEDDFGEDAEYSVRDGPVQEHVSCRGGPR